MKTVEEKAIEYIENTFVHNEECYDQEDLMKCYIDGYELAKSEYSLLIGTSLNSLTHIMESCDNLTTGNVSHNKNTIKGIAKRTIEFINNKTSK